MTLRFGPPRGVVVQRRIRRQVLVENKIMNELTTIGETAHGFGPKAASQRDAALRKKVPAR